MNASLKRINLGPFARHVILPTLLTIALFVALIFAYIIPSLERNMLNSKREAIRELVAAAHSVVNRYYLDAEAGLMNETDARAAAVSRLASMRYGVDNKDYFWITDMHPTMVMHPYRPDLNGSDLTSFTDPNGKALFTEMVLRVRESGEGYVYYEWQWMDDSQNIVPKISYVRAFEPWGWIIGTGVYIEDVRAEIAAITTRLTLVSLAITGCMAFLLMLIARHNLRAEIKRNQAEAELQVSREKYKALVEASTEGTAMFLGDECIFSNNRFEQLLGIQQTHRISPDLTEIIAPQRVDDIDTIRRFIAGEDAFMQMETFLAPHSGAPQSALISFSRVTLAEQRGLIVVVKELSRSDESAEERSERGRQLLELSDAFGIGIFKCTAGRSAAFLDVNDHLVTVLGYPSKESLLKADLSDLIDDEAALREYLRTLVANRSAREVGFRVRRGDGRFADVSVSAIAELGPDGRIRYLYGTMVDVSKQASIERQQTEILHDLQGRLLFTNQPVRGMTKEVVACDMSTPASHAVQLMFRYKTDVLLVRASTGEYVGMLTDTDIRKCLLQPLASFTEPVHEIMSAPLVTIDEQASLAQAIVLMQERNVTHLGVKNGAGEIFGTLNRSDLVNLQHSTADVLAVAVNSAVSVDSLRSIYHRLPLYVQSLSESGARTSVITDAITATSDAISARLETFLLDELGPPPVPFAFVALGSEGRREQTLLTDQDNAIIFGDVQDRNSDEIRSYFNEYAGKMCRLLNEIGYRYCQGEVMASNVRWNQPLAEWNRYFTKWIKQPEPQHLLESAIFFDFRRVHGDASLVETLGRNVRRLLAENPSFLAHLAREAVSYKTPLGLFGKIQTESDMDHRMGFNIKGPLRVIVSLVRLYTMKHQLSESNTIRRIQRLYEANVFSASFYKDLLYAYDYMMVLQLRTQARAFSRGKEISNHVDLSDMSAIELNTLKHVLSQLGTFQNKAKYDFGISE